MTDFPTVLGVVDTLQGLRAKLSFIHQAHKVTQSADTGFLQIEAEILEGLELAANDLDVIDERLAGRLV